MAVLLFLTVKTFLEGENISMTTPSATGLNSHEGQAVGGQS